MYWSMLSSASWSTWPMIIYCFTSRSRIFHFYGDVAIAGEDLQNLGLRSALREGSLSCHACYDMWYLFFLVSSEDQQVCDFILVSFWYRFRTFVVVSLYEVKEKVVMIRRWSDSRWSCTTTRSSEVDKADVCVWLVVGVYDRSPKYKTPNDNLPALLSSTL
jgi:hypothetical protein